MSDDKLNWAGASVGFSEADLRGGDETADESVAAELATLLPRLPRVKITPQTISQTIIDRWYGYETEYRQTIAELRAELAAANERAEKAEAEAERLSDVNYHVNQGAVFYQQKYDEVVRERDSGRAAAAVYEANAKLRAQRDEARARLAELTLLRLEWSTANCYSDLGDDIVSERLARDRVASRPEIHAAVVSRQIYAGPWCEGACRSCGTDKRVAGDPPLCSNCTVYGGGWSAQRPDASLDGLRGPFTGLLGPFGLNSEESDNA